MKDFLKNCLLFSILSSITYFFYHNASKNIENSENRHKDEVQQIKIGLENKTLIQSDLIKVVVDDYVIEYYQFKTPEGITCITQKNDIRAISCVH